MNNWKRLISEFSGITQILVDEYYDLHGQKIPGDQRIIKCKKTDLIRVLERKDRILGMDVDLWHVTVNDVDITDDIGEVTGVKQISKTILALHACTGAG